MMFPAKAPVVGTPISLTSYEEVFDIFDTRPRDRALVVAVCNVHSVMSARRDPALANALNTAQLATPDGVPLVWVLRRTVNPTQERVYGPELMRLALLESGQRGWRNYLYGSTPEILDGLRTKIAELAPDATIAGSHSPPFRRLTPEEEAADAERILASGADIVWVGLGMPKQELWMHRMSERLPGVAVVGVGAAFAFISGATKQAPAWIQRAGLEWLYRLIQEPRRLWRRYAWNNPAFVALASQQLLTHRMRTRRNAAAMPTDGGDR